MSKVLFLAIALFIYYLDIQDDFQKIYIFWSYSLLNVCISGRLIYNIYKRDNKIGFLHPTVITSFDFFTLGFGITNFISEEYLPNSLIEEFPSDNPLFYINVVMFWSVLAHLCLWLGSEMDNNLIRKWFNNNLQKKALKKNKINILVVRILYLFSSISNFTLIYLGYYGVNVNEDLVEEANSWVGILKILSNFGLLSFLFSILFYFKEKKGRNWVIGILLMEIFFGLVAGYKNQIFVPFIIMTFSYFYIYRKVNFIYIIAAVLAIQVAYGLVQPYREILLRSKNEQPGIKDMVEMYLAAQEYKDELSNFMDKSPLYIQIANRMNLLTPTTIAYYHFYHYGPVSEYRIPERLIYLPLMTIIPKSLWQDKPINNIGHITTQKVYGHYSDNITSITVTSIGYGFLGWGYMWVIIPIFILFGFIQNFYAKLLYQLGLVGLVIYLAAMPQLVKIEELSLFLITILRSIIIGFIIQKIILTKASKPVLNL